MTDADFNNSKSTIDAAIAHVLDSGLPGIQVAVVQYGTLESKKHDYDITVPFTDDKTVATSWGRKYGSSGFTGWNQDHQPGSLAKMRRDNVYAEGGALDVSDASNVQFVFFTDAWRDYSASCCSSVVADNRWLVEDYVHRGFGEYDVLKDGTVLPNGIQAQFTLLHAAPNTASQSAGAAIASVGGEYTGSVESNPSDPDGAGVTPRRYLLGDLTSTDTEKVVQLLDLVFEEIDIVSSLAAPSVTTKQTNQTRHSDRLYYTLFDPGQKHNWRGNVKAYRVNEEGVLVDKRGNPAIDEETSGFGENTRSFWSSEDDGSDVGVGGYTSKMTNSRPWYTEVDGELIAVDEVADVPTSAFGASVTEAQRNTAVRWALGIDSVDFDGDEDTTETAHFMADVLHSSPMLVNYRFNRNTDASRDILFATSNLGRLHAINPSNGKERWSYTPSELLPNLLTAAEERDDILDHQYGLDGQMTFFADKVQRSTTSTRLQRGYLYLTQRRGGSGLFALDVSGGLKTSGAPFSVKWKINNTTTGYGDLGQTWSRPIVAKVDLNCTTVCEKRDVLVLTGGYDESFDTLGYRSGTSSRNGLGNAIYLIDPLTGERLWSAGGSDTHDLRLDMEASFPSEPVVVDTDGDGAIEVIFALDVTGKVWRIDLDSTATSMSGVHIGGGAIADFSGAEGGNLRFYNKPDVSIQSGGSGAARFDIAIGSGSRPNPLANEPGKNTFFIVRDPWVHRSPVVMNASTGEVEPDYRYVVSGSSRALISEHDLGEIGDSGTAPSAYGYYKRLDDDTEKFLAPSLTYGGKTLVLTYVPPDLTGITLVGCSFALGTSKLRVYDTRSRRFENITSSGEESIDVAPGIASQVGLIDTGDTDGVQLVVGTSTVDLDEVADIDTSNMRRIYRTSWRELD